MSDEQEIAVTETAPTYAEAPYSANVKTRIHGYDFQLTVRANNNAEFTKKINNMIHWLDTTTEKPIAGAPMPPVAPNGNMPAAPVAPPTPATAIQTIRAIKLQIEPRADGKVNLKFFEAGHQYPDLTAVKTPAEAAAMLQPLGAWTPAHMIAREEAISAVIDWKPSANLNKNGKPYKNIVTISPAA